MRTSPREKQKKETGKKSDKSLNLLSASFFPVSACRERWNSEGTKTKKYDLISPACREGLHAGVTALECLVVVPWKRPAMTVNPTTGVILILKSYFVS